MTTLKPVLNGLERAQRLQVPLTYTTKQTSTARVTALGDGKYAVSIRIPLADVKPPNVNERVRNAALNGFDPKLTQPGAIRDLTGGAPVSVAVKGHTLEIETVITGDPSALTKIVAETQALDLAFTHPRGMPEFRVQAKLAELTLDRTPVERAMAETAAAEARSSVRAWESEFEEAKANVPSQAAALEKERSAAALAVAQAERAVARSRAAIDARAETLPASTLGAVLRTLEVPAGKELRDAKLALGHARAVLTDAETLEAGRTELARAGVDPDELGPRPDLAAARARVAESEARVAQAETAVREAFAQDPGGVAHVVLATTTGDAGDRARSAALQQDLAALTNATERARDAAQRQVDDPAAGFYPQVIAAAEAEVRRLDAALAELRPAVSTQVFAPAPATVQWDHR